MLFTQLARLNSSDAKKNSNCYCGGGRGPRVAKAKWCSFRAKPGSESLD
jgi:hypothetical protein